MNTLAKLQAVSESRGKELGVMRKTSERVALIDRGQITVYARSLRRLRVFDSWSECLTYACRVARDRRDLAARQSQTAARPA
jgi:hypothetical protein